MRDESDKIVRIFIASSIVEFGEERTQLMAFEAFLNRVYRNHNFRFEINLSELYSNCMSKDGKQKEYNIELRKSRFVYFLIGKSIGKYTRGEFLEAKDQYRNTNLPLIYTFFRYDINNPLVDDSVRWFVQEDLGFYTDDNTKEGGEHYYTTFNHIDTIKLNIMSELARHPDIGGTIEFQDGHAQLNGEKVAPLKNIPMYQNNGDLTSLKEQYEDLNEEYLKITSQLSTKQDFSVISRAYEIGLQRNSLIEEIKRIEKRILDNYLSYIGKARYGSEINWREQEALAFYNSGDYVSGDSVLDDVLWEKEVEIVDELGEKVTQTIHEYISGKRILISSLLTREINEELLWKITDLYSKLTGLSEKYQTDFDVLYDFASFLCDQRNYKDALVIAKRLQKYYDLQPVSSNLKKYDLLILLGRLHVSYKEFADAIKCYNHAEELINELGSESLVKKMELYLRRANVRISIKEYTEAESDLQAIINNSDSAENIQRIYILMDTYRSLGRCNSAKKRNDDAVGFYQKSIKLCLGFKGYEKDEKIMEGLSATYNNLGYIFSEKIGDYSKAEDYYRQSLEIKHQFFLKNPSRWASKYALGKTNFSSICLKNGKVEEAVSSAKEAYEIRAGLYQADPEAFGFGFAVTCYKLSNAEQEIGNMKAAVKYGKQSVNICEQFYHKNPTATAEEMSIAYRIYANSLNDEDKELSEENYKKMLRVESDEPWLVNVYPHTLFNNHRCYAKFLVKVGNRSEAKEQYEKAMRFVNDMEGFNSEKEQIRREILNI